MREYNDVGELIFEGEYLNGKKNGKGKEYYNDRGLNHYEYELIYHARGRLKFNGEYKFGLRWNGEGYDQKNNIVYQMKNGKGNVKEYNWDDTLIFEGEYLNGKKNGQAKEYEYDGKLIFEGNYVDGLKNGQGKEYDYNGELEFEGEFLYGSKLRGSEYIKGRLEYEGEYLLSKKWNGVGYDENKNVIYTLNNGKGKCKEYSYNGKLIFEGEYLNGKRNGKGKEYGYNGNLIFEGKYLNGKKV